MNSIPETSDENDIDPVMPSYDGSTNNIWQLQLLLVTFYDKLIRGTGSLLGQSLNTFHNRVCPIRYAHGSVVFCLEVDMSSVVVESHGTFTHVLKDFFAVT